MKQLAYGVLTIAFGALALYLAFHVSSEVRGKRDWPTTTGRIKERGLGERTGTRGQRVVPRVVYEYTVGGKTFVNDQVHLLANTGLEPADAQKLVDEMRDPVTVHYNPKDPAQSYLLPSSMTWFYILLPAGIVLLLIGALLVFANLPLKGRS